MASRLSQPLRAWRIADSRHPVFDGGGAALHGARWNSPGARIIYAAETYAGAVLEKLVRTGIGSIPRRQVYVEISIPAGVTVEEAAPDAVPGWDGADQRASRAFGDRWYREARSAVLLVPSIVTRVERNILIHQGHADFQKIKASRGKPVIWDKRLFER